MVGASVLRSAYESYLEMDLSGMLGAWIAISKGTVIAVGQSPKEAYEKAMRADPPGKFLLTKVTSKELEIL